VALALADHGKWLFVANQRSGSITVIDTATLRPHAEVPVGRGLADLVATPDGRYLVAVDEQAHQLVLLSRQGPSLAVVHRVPVGHSPVSVQVAGDGSRCFVASLWSRRLTIVDLGPRDGETGDTKPRVLKTVALPFAPRKQLLASNDTKLVVADSFGGRLAVVDVRRSEVESVRPLPAHNIRGLAVSADGAKLLIAHQVLNSLAQTTFTDVHWGNLMTNNLRVLPLTNVLAPDADLLAEGYLHHLGDVGNATGDPSAVAVSGDGKVVLALAGIGEIAIGTQQDFHGKRRAVGRRPTALLTSPDGRRVYVANTFADSVSVVDLTQQKVEAEIRLGPQPDLSLSERGELLFYDARLSHDGWLSCHSCHTDGHTNGLLNDNLGDDSYGAPKRILSLLGVRDTGPWAWNGSMPDLESQIHKSILTTMHGSKPSAEQVKALAAYFRTLAPPPSLTRAMGEADEAVIQRGREVFQKQACGNCHTPPEYTSRKTYDVGLTDEVGNTHFNPPSLRGVSQGGPYFHDNRATSLREVFTRHRHQLKGDLSQQELEELLAFLSSL
jgi:YVTN family beta-propeller protein